jgi:hypothetical protein
MKIRPFLLFFFCAPWIRSEEFVRVRDGKWDTKHLDIAVKTYAVAKPANTQLILVGVSHVGTKSYYRNLQKILNDADVVLFEGVDGDREEFRTLKPEDEISQNNLQVSLADSLGLVFQLHAIDYTPKHFVNSDVTSKQLQELMKGNEIDLEDPGSPREMEKLLEQMKTQNMTGQMIQASLEVLESHPQWGRAMRWCMVMMLGNLTGDVSEYGGLPPKMKDLMKVLIQKRNEVVLHDIRETLKTIGPGKKIAVFYGAAHMADFEKILARDFDATLQKTEWETAFSGNLKTSGLNLIEKSMLQGFMTQQLNAMKIMAGAADTE